MKFWPAFFVRYIFCRAIFPTMLTICLSRLSFVFICLYVRLFTFQPFRNGKNPLGITKKNQKSTRTRRTICRRNENAICFRLFAFIHSSRSVRSPPADILQLSESKFCLSIGKFVSFRPFAHFDCTNFHFGNIFSSLQSNRNQKYRGKPIRQRETLLYTEFYNAWSEWRKATVVGW